jgi:hypothetical protein
MFSCGAAQKNAGEMMKETSIMLLKTNVEKMADIGLSIISLKTKDL